MELHLIRNNLGIICNKNIVAGILFRCWNLCNHLSRSPEEGWEMEAPHSASLEKEMMADHGSRAHPSSFPCGDRSLPPYKSSSRLCDLMVPARFLAGQTSVFISPLCTTTPGWTNSFRKPCGAPNSCPGPPLDLQSMPCKLNSRSSLQRWCT